MIKYLDKITPCNKCIHKVACTAWVNHGKLLYDDFEYEIGDCPYYDVALVRHGKWIEIIKDIGRGRTLTHYQCSLCGVYLAKEANYCPNCGAKMDEKRG